MILTEFVNIETLQTLQDRFSALGRVTVCICTVDGELITTPTWGSRFSELIGTSSLGRKTFTERLRDIAKTPNPQVPLSCHDGMALHAVPILHNHQRLALLVVGTRHPVAPPVDAIREIAATYNLDAELLAKGTDSIDPYSGGDPEAIHRFADALAQTLATLFAQASHIKRQLADLQTVHDLANLLAGSRDLQEILDVTVQRVVEVLAVKACAIRLLNVDTGELVIKAVHNLSDEYLRKGPVTLRDNAIDTQAFADETVYIEDATKDPRIRYPDNAKREGIVSGLCVPMSFRGQTIGVIRVYTSRRYVFSLAEQALLRSIGSQAASAIVSSRLYDEQVRTERVRRQVQTAGEIQRRMLPAEPPSHAALQFGCVYNPALEVGGDFYDFIELQDGALGVCVADVVGKGLPAALLMASVRSALRAYANTSDDLSAVLAQVNRHMCHDTLISEFSTLIYGVFSVDGRSWRYGNAGHLPPLLYRDNQFVELTCGGTVIGVFPEESYESEEIALQSGDVLVMTTDGVIEAMNFQGETFGANRLRTSISVHAALDAEQFAQQILWDVRRFVGLADQSDDITIVVAKSMFE